MDHSIAGFMHVAICWPETPEGVLQFANF